MVVSPTHARGGILDFMMTDVPDLVRVAVVERIGSSNHFDVPTLSGRTGSALAWHFEGRIFAAH